MWQKIELLPISWLVLIMHKLALPVDKIMRLYTSGYAFEMNWLLCSLALDI